METLKNFFTGLVVIVVSLILFAIISFGWPLIIGLGSVLLSLITAVLFLAMVFFLVVLIGKIVRELLSKK